MEWVIQVQNGTVWIPIQVGYSAIGIYTFQTVITTVIADYCSRDGAVGPVPKTLFCSTVQTLQMTVLETGQTAPSLEQ